MTPTSPPVPDDIVQLGSTTGRSEQPAGETQQENPQPDASLGVEQSKMEELVPGLLNELPCLKAEYDRFDLFRTQEISRLAAVDSQQVIEGQRLEAELKRLSKGIKHLESCRIEEAESRQEVLREQVRLKAEAEQFEDLQAEVAKRIAMIGASQDQDRERLKTEQRDLKARARRIEALESEHLAESAGERVALILERQEFDHFRNEETMRLDAMRDHQKIENERLDERREHLKGEQKRLKREKGHLKDEARRLESSRRRFADRLAEHDRIIEAPKQRQWQKIEQSKEARPADLWSVRDLIHAGLARTSHARARLESQSGLLDLNNPRL